MEANVCEDSRGWRASLLNPLLPVCTSDPSSKASQWEIVRSMGSKAARRSCVVAIGGSRSSTQAKCFLQKLDVSKVTPATFARIALNYLRFTLCKSPLPWRPSTHPSQSKLPSDIWHVIACFRRQQSYFNHPTSLDPFSFVCFKLWPFLAPERPLP